MSNIIAWLKQPKNLWKLFGFAILSVVLFFTLVRIGVFGKLPSFEVIENPNANLASEVYSEDSVLIGKYFVDNRSNISYSELSPYLVKALVANEDERFYEHSGIDFWGTFRAVITLGKNGGGSTITQQLAKNMFHNRAHNFVQRIMQKAKEYVIAVMLERRYTKDEIIAMYFNTFDFVNNAVGIESAARIYFNKKPKDLSIEECAMFVGMLQNPSYYNPRRFAKRTLERRATVLRKLMDKGDITVVQFNALKDKPIELDFHPETANDGLAPYFRMVVAQQLKQWTKDNKKADGSEYNIYTDGLKIYTTINTRMQKYAEEAAVQHLERYQKYLDNQFNSGWHPWETENGKKILETACKYTFRWEALEAQGLSKSEILKNFKTDKYRMKVFTYKGMKDTTLTPYDSIKYYKSMLQIGMMVVEPYTGYVRAWVGGPNFEFFKYDHCNINTKRQVGSTFKPIVYALAVDNGWSPCMVISPGKVQIGNWAPRGGSTGPQTLMHALKTSNNQMAAYITKQFGVNPIIDLSRRLFITSDLPPYAPICLGAADISLEEMMAVYSTFPSAGICTKPQYILRIEDKDGNVVQNFSTKMKEVFSDNIAYKMCQLMKGPVSRGGTAAGLHGYFSYPVDVAGKTGTTNKNTDAWFIGYTPELVCGVWVGCDDPLIRFLYTGIGQGGRAAMPAFGMFMQKAYSDPKLGLNKNAKFFTPSDANLVTDLCNDQDEITIDANSNSWGQVDEENQDSEY
ncbi:MAG: transglycosylase domain-containing protein [Bacteroidetes bacterium]|nr:transglycosylase domain-containing protein [Bacteroidota bacterium]